MLTSWTWKFWVSKSRRLNLIELLKLVSEGSEFTKITKTKTMLFENLMIKISHKNLKQAEEMIKSLYIHLPGTEPANGWLGQRRKVT